MRNPPRLLPVGTGRDDIEDLPHASSIGQRRIGAIMIDSGMLRVDHAERVLELQRDRGGRFGDIAVSLGYATHAQVEFALARQRGAPSLLPGDRARFGAALRAAFDDPTVLRAYTDARTQLELRWFGEAPERRLLAVVSDAPGEGRSLATCMVGLLLAMTGRRVLLVDGCVETPGLAPMLGLLPGTGAAAGAGPAPAPAPVALADALHQPESALRLPSLFESVDLSLLAAGTGGLDPDATASRAFASMLGTLAAGWDAIIVDTLAWSADRRAFAIAVRCSGVLVTVRLGRTRMARLETMRRLLADAGVEAVGALAQRF